MDWYSQAPAPHAAGLNPIFVSGTVFSSFQQPDKIADAIRLFSDVKLWQQVALELAIPEQDVKARLKLIVDRRNKIAHEADVDPSFPNMRWPITESDY